MKVVQELNQTVAEIVRADYRTADVFRKHGINYCCGGKIPLAEACGIIGLDLSAIALELDQATKTISLPNNLQFNDWKIDFLIEYIINVHHAYVKQAMPGLEANLHSFIGSHQKQYPEIVEIGVIFSEMVRVLNFHNQHEEEVIFPYIKQIENTYRRKETYGHLFVRTLRKPLEAIEKEHQRIDHLLQSLRSLTQGYRIPEKACTNHRVVLQKLQEFDNDLVQHKHLENNILFPKATEMEKELLGAAM